MKQKMEKIERLVGVLKQVRGECPWDKKQTMQTLKPLTIEECYELVDAINDKDNEHIKEELGDVLMHILFYAELAEEKGDFNIGDVADTISEKLIRRHPHVFGTTKVEDEEEVLVNWEKIKQEERKDNKGNKGVLSGVPSALPPMIKALRIQHKASKVGYDWEDKKDIWSKLDEEVGECKQAIAENVPQEIEAEIGDMFFTAINIARAYGVDPENALELSNKKFIRRFNHIEKRLSENNKTFKEVSVEEMDMFWEEAKKGE